MSLLVGNLLALGVAALHVYFAVLEMLLWRGRARKIFRTSEEFANASAGLAANQGLYNLFLTAGIVYGVLVTGNADATSFALGCVVVAGVFGAQTASKVILYVQAAPAAAALLLVQIGAKGLAGAVPALLVAGVLVGAFGFALGKHVGDRERALKPKAAAAAAN